MLISHETPLCMLGQSHSYNDYDYCLVHLLPEHNEYKDFYFDSVHKGRHVLLDNSIFELGEAYDSEKYAQWVLDLKPTEYIIPDSLENFNQTIISFNNFKEKYGNLPGKTIGVVQGKTYDELKQCYLFMADRVDKVAISFDYSYYKNNNSKARDISQSVIGEIKDNKWSEYAMGRIQFLQDLLEDGVLRMDKPHHLLGCSVPWEFKIIKTMNTFSKCIATIDTSNPIVAGILNTKYNNTYGLHEKWSFKLVDFISNDLTDTQKNVSLENIKTFKQFCS